MAKKKKQNPHPDKKQKTAALPKEEILNAAEQAAEAEQTSAEESAQEKAAEILSEPAAEASAEAAAAEEAAQDTPEEASAEPDAAPDASAESAEPEYSFKTLVSDIRSMFTKYELPDMLLSRCIGAYFLTIGFWIALFRKQNSTNPIADWKVFVGNLCEGKRMLFSVCIIAAIFVLMTCISYLMPKKAKVSDPLIAIGAVLFFDAAMLWRANNPYLTFAVTFVSLAFIYYELGKLKTLTVLDNLSWKKCGIAALVLTVCMTVFIAGLTVDRHKVFGTASHDFGLFVQMFHSLATRFTAITTCEREYPISHFRIHASYIYYLLVPVYKLFPKESTLLIAQAVLAMGGAIPTFLIAKRHNFKGIPLLFITIGYIFSDCFVAPCFYDFHENAFLPTLLMWLLWAVDGERHILSAVFAVLVCITKEDAPLYIMCIGLFMFFSTKGKKLFIRAEGLIYCAVSGGYMVFITKWLTKNGDGQFMTSTRFGNMMIDPEGGLIEVMRNVLLDPAYFFSLLIKEETLRFFITVMLPMLFLPFLTKKIYRFWLMVPFIVMNLAIGAGYGYAADVNFHYVFGTGALLLYMVILNVDDLGEERKQAAAILTGAATMMFFFGTVSQQISNRDSYRGSKEGFDAVHEMLSSLPEDKVVCATAFLLPHCCNRDYIYLIDGLDFESETDRLINPEKYDFIVMGPNGDIGQRAIPQLETLGWTIYDEVDGRAVVYQNPASPVTYPDVYAAKAD